MALTVALIETRALKLADSQTGDFSTTADVIPFINAGQREIIKLTDCLVGSDTIVTTDAEDTYSLNSDFWKEKRVTIDGDKATFMEYDELQSLIAGDITADTARYALWNDNIIIYSGDTIVAGDDIVIDYFRFAADVTSSSSQTEIPDKYADALEFYAAARMAEDNADYALAERRMSQFFNHISLARANDRRRRSGPRKIKQAINDRYSF